ncbi:MAG: PAS domain S-box protein [Candidatus Manganitrophaceae bacterium]|nr:MAG: PAS domain S-box protein [Candidatus Manganitrophaceae bacterium]
MKAAPLNQRTPGAPTRSPLQKLIRSLFQAPSALAVLTLTLLLTGLAWHNTRQSIENSARAGFERKVTNASRAIEERIQTYIDTLISARSLFVMNENLTRADWKKYFESLQLQKRYPGIHDFAFARYVPASQRAEFERRVRGDRSLDQGGYPDFSIHPEGARPAYFPIEYIEPFSPPLKQFGFDIGSDPLRRSALDQARDTDRPVSTGRIILITSERIGFAIRLPVYRNGLPQAATEERRRALLGFITVAFDMKELIEGIFGHDVPRDFDFEIFDGGTEKTADPSSLLTRERLLYDNDDLLQADTQKYRPRYAKTTSLEIAGRVWQIHFSTYPHMESGGEEENLPPLVLLGGVTISLLLSYITWSKTTAHRRAVELAESMTADLRESEERFRAIFNQAPSGISVVNPQGSYLDLNERLSEMMGYTKEELLARTFQDITHPDDLAPNLEFKERLLAGEIHTYKMEKRYIRKDGRIVWTNLTVSPVYDRSGRLKYLVAIVDDITDRKEADEKLRRSESQLAKAEEIAHLGSWSFDLMTQSISWSDELYRVYGLAPQSVKLTHDFVSRYNHPEDQDRVSRIISQSTRDLQPFGFDYRILLQDGSIRTIHAEGEVLSDQNGQAIRMVGTAQDITERKQAEKALRETNQALQAIIESSPLAIISLDLKGKVKTWNPAAEQIFGWSAEEAIGRFNPIIPDDQRNEFKSRVRALLEGAVFPSLEVSRQRKDGSRIDMLLSTAALRDANGEVQGFIGLLADQTVQKQAEEALRKSEARFRRIVDSNMIGIVFSDVQGRIIEANDAFLQIAGYTHEELRGGEISWKAMTPPEYSRLDLKAVEEMKATGICTPFEKEFIRKDGSRIPVMIGAAFLEGSQEQTVGFVFDISKRKQMEEELRKSETRFRRLAESNLLGIGFWDANGTITEANDAFLKMVGYSQEELRAGLVRWRDMTPEEYLHLDERALAEISEKGACAPFEKEYIRKDGTRIPILIGGASMEGEHYRGVCFVLDMTDRKQADERLRQSEEKYRLLFEDNPHPMWVFDLETLAFLAVNEAAVRHYGYSREEFLSMTIKDLTPTEDIPTLIEALPQISTRIGPAGIWRNRKKDGTVIDVEMTSDIISFSGRRSKLVLANDVTERLLAEEALRRSEEQYRILFDRNPHPMWVIDPRTHAFLAVNEEAIRHYGYSREEFLQMTIFDIRPPEEISLLKNYLEEAARRETTPEPAKAGVWIHRKKDGALIEVEITWNLIFFRGRETRLIMAEDVTESRKTERELQDSERRFRQLAENIHEVFWIVERDPQRVLYISPAYEKIWGRTCQSLYEDPFSFLEAVHPEDRGELLASMEKQQNGEGTELAYRVIHPDGSIRWVRDRAFPIRDASGKVYRIAGVAEDITEHRRAEVALQETNQTLRALIHSSPLAIFSLDTEGRVKMWNPAAERIFGWTEHEVLNRPFPLLSSNPEEELQAIRKLILDGSGFTGMEARRARKDGSLIDLSLSLAPLPGAGPMTTGIVAVVADISDRKKTEEALRKSEERFHLITRATNDAIWDWDLITNALWWNEGFKTIFGYTTEEIEPGIESWEGRIHPEDKERILSSIHAAVEQCDQFWSDEYRFRRGDGSYATILDRGYVVHDRNGRAVRMIGAMMDITNRKQAEEALQVKTEQLGAVTDAMTAYLDSRDWHETSSRLLRSALHQTQSEYGFIGVVVEGPVLRILAVEGVDQEAMNRPFYAEAVRIDQKQEYLELNRFDNLFGKVIQTGKAVLSNAPATDPRSGGLPSGHPLLRTFLGVPIIRDNQVVGLIGIANRPGGYSETDQAGLEIVSNATGILYDSYRRREREIALENHQRNVEKELRHSQEQLRSLSSRLHSMVEEERTRISREIHDELGQLLTILKMELSWLKKRLPKKEELLRDRTKSMAKLVDTTVQTLRKISTELRPGVLDDLGLTAAIEWQVQEFQARTKLCCSLTVRPEEITLDPERSTTVFRIFQETLTNIVRHANADEVAIRLEKTEESLTLEVRDNGKGITQNQITNSKSLGLLGIRERALLWGGTVHISGLPGKGTTVTVQIPLHPPSDRGKPS